jgi:hypothetical protein
MIRFWDFKLSGAPPLLSGVVTPPSPTGTSTTLAAACGLDAVGTDVLEATEARKLDAAALRARERGGTPPCDRSGQVATK